MFIYSNFSCELFDVVFFHGVLFYFIFSIEDFIC